MADGHRVARIYVLAGPDLARSFALAERSTLGRSGECDVVLHHRSISRKHAALVRQGETWFVQDLGSTNGISKDGRRAERFDLADGDEFHLGDLPLRFRLVAENEGDEIEFSSAPAPAPGAAPSASVEVEPRAPIPPARVEPASAPEVELEVEIEIGDAEAPRRQPGRAPLPATTFSPARVARRTGFFAGDLEQQPLWLRGLIVLVVLALCAGLCYGAFWAVHVLRAGS